MTKVSSPYFNDWSNLSAVALHYGGEPNNETLKILEANSKLQCVFGPNK